MKKFDYVIKDEIGIHARPAGLLVKEAKKYESKITMEANGKKAEATKLMLIMAMGIKCGQTVTVQVEGADEEIAYENIKKFFEDNI
ncbi:MAG: HPr family phosphocarrier protein [Lachnospiraceae bacterium]|nr:HPr family phosphocarrier protein [Lachnospiraceae bacterium]